MYIFDVIKYFVVMFTFRTNCDNSNYQYIDSKGLYIQVKFHNHAKIKYLIFISKKCI